MTKACISCGQLKPLESFTKAKKSKNGRSNKCKACSAAYIREYYAKNPDKAASNRSKQAIRDSGKNARIRHRISIFEHDEMLKKYDGMCWSCQVRPGTSVDHDHSCCPGRFSCGRCVRGILCHQCNTALGLLGDSQETIKKLLEYARLVKRL